MFKLCSIFSNKKNYFGIIPTKCGPKLLTRYNLSLSSFRSYMKSYITISQENFNRKFHLYIKQGSYTFFTRKFKYFSRHKFQFSRTNFSDTLCTFLSKIVDLKKTIYLNAWLCSFQGLSPNSWTFKSLIFLIAFSSVFKDFKDLLRTLIKEKFKVLANRE